MRASALHILILAVWLSGAICPRADEDRLYDLFKWGEYDSLIGYLEPRLAAGGVSAAPANRDDSIRLAKSNLLLGVAYHGVGEAAKGDEAFLQACRLDGTLELDQFYVSREIASRFQALALAQRRAPAEAASPPSPSSGSPPPVSPGSGGKNAGKVRKKNWLWWGTGAVASLAAAGGAYWILNREIDNKPRVTVIDIR